MILPINPIKQTGGTPNFRNSISLKTQNTVTNSYQISSDSFVERKKKQMTMVNILGLFVAGLVVWKLLSKGITKLNSNNPINAIKAEMNKFPKDIEYRKNILKNMNLPPEDYYKLRSIIGTQELSHELKTLAQDKEHFLPGIKHYREDFEAIFPNRENVQSGKFAANLHLHTLYSDGKFTVPELLEQAVKYADQRAGKLGENNPFYLAITDHDTVQGCKEAIDIILKDPEKFKNLRLVLGIEHTTIAEHPKFLNGPVHTHMITYCLNPHNPTLQDFLNKGVNTNRINITKALDNANRIFRHILNQANFQYSYEEFLRLAPEIQYGAKSADYYAKDYMQFKLIHAAALESHEGLMNLLKSKNIHIDFTTPIAYIPKDPLCINETRYYDYYFEALKSCIKAELGQPYHAVIDGNLARIPEDLRIVLEKFENSVHDPKSLFHVPPVKFRQFEEVVKFMKTQDGVMGIAHPGVVFPFYNLKNEAETIKFYDALYQNFKNLGGEKAIYAEDLYAAYYESNTYLSGELAKISEKHGLKKSGGLDTHIADIFCSK